MVKREVSFRGQRWLLECPDRDFVGGRIRNTGQPFEATELDLLARLFDATGIRGTCLDVGANIGNHAVAFSRMGFRLVVAVEMMADACVYLRANLQAEARSEWRVDQVALTGDGSRDWMVMTTKGNMGMARLVPAGSVPKHGVLEPVLAPLRMLDDLDLPSDVSFVKVDVETHEALVMSGARHLLTTQKPLLMVESDSKHRPALEDVLRPLGYEEGLQMVKGSTNWLYDHRDRADARLVEAFRLKEGTWT